MKLSLLIRRALAILVLLVSGLKTDLAVSMAEKSAAVCIKDADQLVKVLGELCVLHEGLTLGADALVKFDQDELYGVFAVEEIVKIVIQTRKILELFCKQFDEFTKTVNERIELEVIAQFKLLCEKLEDIELDLKAHDLLMCSKIPALEQTINRAEDRFVVAIYTVQHALTLCNNYLKSTLSDAQVDQIITDQNLFMLFSSVQKNISTLCQSLLTDLHILVVDETNQDIAHINQARKVLVDGYQNTQSELCQAQMNMLSAVSEDTQSMLMLLVSQANVLKAKLCLLENNMSNTIARNSKSLELMAALNSNEMCKQLSTIRASMALGHNQVREALSDFGAEISRQNTGISAKISAVNTELNKLLILEFGLLEASLVSLSQQLVTKIALVNDEIRTLISYEFGQIECTLAQYQDSIRSQLLAIQTMVEATAKQGLQNTCQILLSGMGELTSKIGTLSADACLFNTEVINGLEKLDANISGALCRKMSNFNLEQQNNTRELSDQILAVQGGLTSAVTSKLSHFETNISRQRDALSSKLSVFESSVTNIAAQKLNNFACNTAMRQGALCSKVMAIEAGLEAATQIQVSAFTTNVSQQLDAICSALLNAEISLVGNTGSSIDSAQSQIDMRYDDLCIRIESGQDTLASEQNDLCLQVSALDAFIQANIALQSTALCDDLEALLFKTMLISISLTVLSILTSTLAGRTAPIPPLPV